MDAALEKGEVTAILRRVGLLLAAMGLLELSLAIIVLRRGDAFSGFFIFPGLIEAYVLFRGRLRWVRLIRNWNAFFLGAGTGILTLFPFVEPWDLTLTRFRLDFFPMVLASTYGFTALLVLAWVVVQLGRPEIVTASTNAGLTISKGSRYLGAGLLACCTIMILIKVFLFQSDTVLNSIDRAREQLGNEYKYHVSSFSVSVSSTGKRVQATITAWNDREIKLVRIGWEE